MLFLVGDWENEFFSRNKKLKSMILEDELVRFLDEDILTDVAIHSRDGTLIMRAHKIVLAARSR